RTGDNRRIGLFVRFGGNMTLSGDQYEIFAGGYQAVVTEQGGGLRTRAGGERSAAGTVAEPDRSRTVRVRGRDDDARGDVYRAGLGAEPMICPPNAFVSGIDLIVLEPGEGVTGSWGIAGA